MLLSLVDKLKCKMN